MVNVLTSVSTHVAPISASAHQDTNSVPINVPVKVSSVYQVNTDVKYVSATSKISACAPGRVFCTFDNFHQNFYERTISVL